MPKPEVRTTTVTTTTKTITISEEQAADILRRHFDMPKATVDFDVYHEALESITLTEKTESST